MENAIRKKGISKTLRNDIIGYAFLLPFLVLFFIFIVLPVLSSLFISFTDYNMLQPAKFIGLNNYKLLFLEDDVFLIALKNTFIFAAIAGPIGFIMSFMFAWLIENMKFKSFFALAFYAPSLTSSVAMSVIWLYFFSSDRYGFINNILIKLGFIDTPILWVTDPKYIMTVIIIIAIWMSMGNGFLVFLAGFQNLSKDVFEAAKIDGMSNKFQELFYITLPMMKQQLLFGSITAIVTSLSVFDIAVTVSGLPSPEYAGHTIVAHLYDYAFIRLQMGYASAIACVLFLITFLLGRICMKAFKSND